MYHPRVGYYVGIDTDYEGIYSATDGAINRYKALKDKFPDFGKVVYIQADGGVLLNSTEQSKNISGMNKDNIKSIDMVFNKKNQFDVISSQFAIHYLFGTSITINNLIENIKNNLRIGGFIILTLFDAEKVMSVIGKNNKYTSYYTDDDGKKIKFFEIIKKFDGDMIDEPGKSIDVHMSWISEEDKYIEEYLVSKNLLIDTMKKAGCMLVDTELFSSIYETNKPYFENVIQYEENPKNKKFYEKVAHFYGNMKGADKESKNYSFLNRYYIFKKIEK